MAWSIAVAPAVASYLRSLDAALRHELIEQVDALADAPAAHLTRTAPPWPVGLYMFTYESGVLAGLTVRLFFDGWDEDPRRLALVAVTQAYREPEDLD